jgi:hypothetical protein
MNNQIKELAIECYNPYSNFDVEKFAELLIKECIDYCGDNLSKTVGEALKIHFGINDE